MILTNPITLPASKMISTMTALLLEVRFNDTLGPSDIVNDMVDSARVGKVEYGKGIVYNFKVGLQPTKDLSENSSAMTITKPNVAQETITIDEYKFVPISMSDVLSKDSMTNGTSLNDFFAFVMGLAEDTAQFNLFDEVNALYQNWVPGQDTQTIRVDQIDTTNLTGIDRNEALKWNATEMAKVLRKTVNNMKIKNTKFTDVATYNDVNTGEQEQVISCLRNDDLKLVMNDKYYTNFLADAMASLYHSEKVGAMIPGDKFVLLPEDAMSEENEDTIGWLSDKLKFALADFYVVTLSWKDPSTLYTNTFYHYAYGTGVFKYAPGIKFVANIIEPNA